MGVQVVKAQGQVPDEAELREWFVGEGLSPSAWGNSPGDTYGAHSHGYRKILFCLSGSIVFHTDEGDVELHAGDRLDVEPGTEHSATVGPDGVRCIEAAREG
jgi:quercetin dioxygenase-like cupin family protein